MARVIFSCVAFILGASPCGAEVPKLFREDAYTCASLAEAVNHYVDLGEEAAIKELEGLTLDWTKDFKSKFSTNERVGWVCRILFQPKEKDPLRPPLFGALELPHHSMPSQSWPLYPVAASGKTYFVLSQGYSLGGVPEEPKSYLKYCHAEGKFRKERVDVPTRTDALNDLEMLRKSDAWKAIKWKDSGPNWSYKLSEDQTWDFIKAQAEKMPEK